MNINNIKYKTLPQQVEQNKLDISDIKLFIETNGYSLFTTQASIETLNSINKSQLVDIGKTPKVGDLIVSDDAYVAQIVDIIDPILMLGHKVPAFGPRGAGFGDRIDDTKEIILNGLNATTFMLMPLQSSDEGYLGVGIRLDGTLYQFTSTIAPSLISIQYLETYGLRINFSNGTYQDITAYNGDQEITFDTGDYLCYLRLVS